jgi:glucoamylase
MLRVELLSTALVRWSVDGWQTDEYTPTRDSGLGTHFADLDTAGLEPGSSIVFRLYWPGDDRWEGSDYEIVVE